MNDLSIQLQFGKKLYFASDFHLGLPNLKESQKRERTLCKWLDEIKADAQALFLVGDIFDAWFEYRNVVPKGFIRFFGKLAELSDIGIFIFIFTGNHDLWMKDYFSKELNAIIYKSPLHLKVNSKKLFIAHGDGLGPKDYGYKLLKRVLQNPISQWLYRRIHPDTGFGIANYFSKKGGEQRFKEQAFSGMDNEWLVLFCNEMLEKEHFDYFIFGHRHLALDVPLGKNSKYINLGDWLTFNSFAVFDGEELQLKYYNSSENE